jgi:hypothetical protein
MGVVMPLMLKPVPLATACDIVTVALPVLVRVIGCLLLLPTAMLPNAMLVGLAVKVEVVATPAPERDRACGEFGALSVKVMLPVAEPETVGAN